MSETWYSFTVAFLGHLLAIAGIAVGYPLALVAIGVAPVLLDYLYSLAVVATLFMCGGAKLELLNRLFFLKPVELPDDAEAPRPVPKIVPPKPYPIRLARFLGVAPSELKNTRSRTGSSMKFWTSLSTFIRHESKPRVLIRFILERIRRAVRDRGRLGPFKSGKGSASRPPRSK